MPNKKMNLHQTLILPLSLFFKRHKPCPYFFFSMCIPHKLRWAPYTFFLQPYFLLFNAPSPKNIYRESWLPFKKTFLLQTHKKNRKSQFHLYHLSSSKSTHRTELTKNFFFHRSVEMRFSTYYYAYHPPKYTHILLLLHQKTFQWSISLFFVMFHVAKK